MNPLGHMVSLTSSTVTSWCRPGTEAWEVDQRLRGAVEIKYFSLKLPAHNDVGWEVWSGLRTDGTVVARARSAPTAVDARRIFASNELVRVPRPNEGVYFFSTGKSTFKCVCPGGSANPSTASLNLTTTLSGVI
jgi:hypothetical protein